MSPVGLEQAVVLEAAAIHGGDLPAVLLQSRHLRDALHFRIAAAEAAAHHLKPSSQNAVAQGAHAIVVRHHGVIGQRN